MTWMSLERLGQRTDHGDPRANRAAVGNLLRDGPVRGRRGRPLSRRSLPSAGAAAHRARDRRAAPDIDPQVRAFGRRRDAAGDRAPAPVRPVRRARRAAGAGRDRAAGRRFARGAVVANRHRSRDPGSRARQPAVAGSSAHAPSSRWRALDPGAPGPRASRRRVRARGSRQGGGRAPQPAPARHVGPAAEHPRARRGEAAPGGRAVARRAARGRTQHATHDLADRRRDRGGAGLVPLRVHGPASFVHAGSGAGGRRRGSARGGSPRTLERVAVSLAAHAAAPRRCHRRHRLLGGEPGRRDRGAHRGRQGHRNARPGDRAPPGGKPPASAPPRPGASAGAGQAARPVPAWLREVLNDLRPVPRGVAKSMLGDPDGDHVAEARVQRSARAARDAGGAGGHRPRARRRGRDPRGGARRQRARDPAPRRRGRGGDRSHAGRRAARRHAAQRARRQVARRAHRGAGGDGDAAAGRGGGHPDGRAARSRPDVPTHAPRWRPRAWPSARPRWPPRRCSRWC